MIRIFYDESPYRGQKCVYLYCDWLIYTCTLNLLSVCYMYHFRPKHMFGFYMDS